MKSLKIKSLVLLTFVGDIIIFLSSYYVISYFISILNGMNGLIGMEMLRFVPVAAIVTIFMMLTFDMYKNIFYRSMSDIVLCILLIVGLSLIIEVFVNYIINAYVLSRSVLIYAALYRAILLSGWRITIWNLRRSIQGKQKVMVIGGMKEAKIITKKIMIYQGHIFDIRYIYDVSKGVQGVYKLIDQVDHVLIGSEVHSELSGQISDYCMKHGKHIFMVPDVLSINLNNASFIQVDDLPMFNISRFGLSFEQKVMKRSVDLIVGLIGLIIAAPIMGIVGILIKLESPGPVFFKQERLTEGNKKFNVIKFRTMVRDAEKMTGPVLACQKDPRVTKLGAFMRSTRIDEIPQIINVLNGTMSLVGPRPERQFFVDKFVKEVPEFEYRTTVKAGVTGLAQVLGKYTTTFEDKLIFDLMYIKNYSILLDFKIILKTIKVVLKREASVGIGKKSTFEMLIKDMGATAKMTNFGYEITSVKTRHSHIMGKAYREVS